MIKIRKRKQDYILSQRIFYLEFHYRKNIVVIKINPKSKWFFHTYTISLNRLHKDNFKKGLYTSAFNL